jgi:hypothetical protein
MKLQLKTLFKLLRERILKKLLLKDQRRYKAFHLVVEAVAHQPNNKQQPLQLKRLNQLNLLQRKKNQKLNQK